MSIDATGPYTARRFCNLNAGGGFVAPVKLLILHTQKFDSALRLCFVDADSSGAEAPTVNPIAIDATSEAGELAEIPCSMCAVCFLCVKWNCFSCEETHTKISNFWFCIWFAVTVGSNVSSGAATSTQAAAADSVDAIGEAGGCVSFSRSLSL